MKPRQEFYFDQKGQLLPDPHQVLSVSPDAPRDEIDRRYRELVLQHPPERDPDGFARIRSAYERLTDPKLFLALRKCRLRSFDLSRYGLTPPPAKETKSSESPPLADEVFLYALTHTLLEGRASDEQAGDDEG